LVERGRPILGVIEHPFLGSRYWAVQGQGAFANGRRIQASRTASLREAIVSLGDYAVGADAERRNQLRLAVTKHLAATVLRVRMLGAAAVDLGWLAEGRLDASITLSNKPWDFAAGVILAREAGAQVVARDGSPHTLDSASVVAVAAPLRDDILDLLRRAEAELATQETVSTKRL
jgi:myo-inositol-1(or 4)-monophosphatase